MKVTGGLALLFNALIFVGYMADLAALPTSLSAHEEFVSNSFHRVSSSFGTRGPALRKISHEAKERYNVMNY